MHAHSAIPANAVQYRPIEGFPGYRVGDDGSVWSCWIRGRYARMTDKWHSVKTAPGTKGYRQVALYRDGHQYCRPVHRLVLVAFRGDPPGPEMEGCHWDGDPSNNRLGNLRWDTKKANSADAIRHGTLPRGEIHGMSKLTEDVVVQVWDIHRSEGVRARMICRRLGLGISSTGSVHSILTGRTWNHVTGLPRRRDINRTSGKR